VSLSLSALAFAEASFRLRLVGQLRNCALHSIIALALHHCALLFALMPCVTLDIRRQSRRVADVIFGFLSSAAPVAYATQCRTLGEFRQRRIAAVAALGGGVGGWVCVRACVCVRAHRARGCVCVVSDKSDR
jgi:hypothetical protein